nr:SIR2 family protein [Clostridia bacterium]
MADTNNKRLESKSFDLTLNKPKVLLLGNGLSRAYNAGSWDHFLNSINTKKEEFPEPDKIEMPMPLKIILLSDNHVGTVMKENKGYFLKGFYDELDKDICTQIRKLFECGFDYILTTNYSYELEYAVYGNSLTENKLKSIQKYIEVERAESKYMLHTFNRVKHNDKDIDIWHIHGEARKPDSMIIGSDYYGRLAFRVIDTASKFDYDTKEGKNINNVRIRSWVDALTFGEVYVLGFGFDYSEQDLWWLINRKANEKILDKGKTYFYEPGNSEKTKVKKSLLNVFDVITEGLDLGYTKDFDYKDFYSAAIDDMAEKLKVKNV